MDKKNDDIFLRLQKTLDSWADEVSETRTLLTQRLGVRRDPVRTAFTLLDTPEEVDSPPELDRDDTNPVVDAKAVRAPEPADTEDTHLRRHIENLEAGVLEMEQRASQAEKHGSRLESELDFARQQLHELNALTQEAESVRSQYQKQAEAAQLALDETETELGELRKEVRGKNWRLLKLQNEVELAREESQRHESIDTTVGPRIQELETELESRRAVEQVLSKQLDEATGRVHSLQEELAATTERVDTLTREGAERRELEDALSRDLGTARSRADELAAELAKSRAETDTLRMEVRDRQSTEETLANHIEESHRRADELTWRMAETASELDDLKSEREADGAQELSLMEQLDDSRTRIDVLESRLSESSAHAAGLTAEVEEIKETLQKKGDLLKAFDEDIARLSAEAERRQVSTDELEQLVGAMRERESAHKQLVEKAETRVREMETSLSRQTETNGALREELNMSEAEAKAKTEALATTREKFESLQESYDSLASDHMIQRQAVTELQSTIIARDHGLEEAGQRADAAEETLRQEVEAMQAKKEELAAQPQAEQSEQAYPSDPDEKDKLVRALREEIGSLREVAVEKDFVINHAQQELEEATRKDSSREKTLREAAATTQRLAGEARGTTRTQHELALEVQRLRTRTVEKDEALRKLRGEVSTLRAQAETAGPDSIEAPMEAEEEIDFQDLQGKLKDLHDEFDADHASHPPELIKFKPPKNRGNEGSVADRVRQALGRAKEMSQAEQGGIRVESAPVAAVSAPSNLQLNADIQEEIERESKNNGPHPSQLLYGVSATLGILGLIGAALSFFIGADGAIAGFQPESLPGPIAQIDLRLWMFVCSGVVASAALGLALVAAYLPVHRND